MEREPPYSKPFYKQNWIKYQRKIDFYLKFQKVSSCSFGEGVESINKQKYSGQTAISFSCKSRRNLTKSKELVILLGESIRVSHNLQGEKSGRPRHDMRCSQQRTCGKTGRCGLWWSLADTGILSRCSSSVIILHVMP